MSKTSPAKKAETPTSLASLAETIRRHIPAWDQGLRSMIMSCETKEEEDRIAYERSALEDISATCDALVLGVTPDMDDLEKVAHLRQQYGADSEHDQYTRGAWQHEVSNNYTSRGYWEWVASEIEADIPTPKTALCRSAQGY